MLSFEPPRHDPASFENAVLDPVGGLIQSLRWFFGRAQMLVYNQCLHLRLETYAQQAEPHRSLPDHLLFMLRRAFFHESIVELRALHDRDPRSLGSRQVYELLGSADARRGLNEHIRRSGHGRVMEDEAKRERYLDYARHYCGIMSASSNRSTLRDHPLSAKTELVRRLANKNVAHSTLDEFRLAGADLDDVVLATTVIACAIEQALGDVAASDDLAQIESAGLRGAALLLNLEKDDAPNTINMIRALLPAWVESGREFPRWPRELKELRGKEAGKS